MGSILPRMDNSPLDSDNAPSDPSGTDSSSATSVSSPDSPSSSSALKGLEAEKEQDLGKPEPSSDIDRNRTDGA